MDIKQLQGSEFPFLLKQINDPPKKLFLKGVIPKTEKYLCVVGSRSNSIYGKEACKKLIRGLKGCSITIVSGLALGIDTIAHKTALENNIPTLAVLGSGLEQKYIYPKSNQKLAKDIVLNNGGLISEFEPNFQATKWSFPKRNRIMAGLSDAILLIEAEEKSGTLITARLATEYNRDVLAVPGSIFSKNSIGTNDLIDQGAKPITKPKDILELFDINLENQNLVKMSEEEKIIFDSLDSPKSKGQLAKELNKNIIEINNTLSLMEISGLITEEKGKIYKSI